MSAAYTKEELDEFRTIVELVESRYQLDRIRGRMIRMPKFVEHHGKEKCDAMFKVLQKEFEESKK